MRATWELWSIDQRSVSFQVKLLCNHFYLKKSIFFRNLRQGMAESIARCSDVGGPKRNALRDYDDVRIVQCWERFQSNVLVVSKGAAWWKCCIHWRRENELHDQPGARSSEISNFVLPWRLPRTHNRCIVHHSFKIHSQDRRTFHGLADRPLPSLQVSVGATLQRKSSRR